MEREKGLDMGDGMTFTRPDGQSVPGYLASPKGVHKAPGLVVLQEWWGLNDQIKTVADRLALAGYRALVPDLYRGKLTASPEEAGRLMGALDFRSAALEDARGAAQHLLASGGKVGVMGFCMGGALAIISAVHVAEFAAAVCYYGIPPLEAADPAQVKIPFQGHFAEHDNWCTPTAVDELERSLAKSGKAYELHRYDAQHAFFNDQRPDVYDSSSAKLSWERTLDFWSRTLAG